jgi:glutamine---fructose-6-phosphate transaminase (isomerizing)
MQLGDLMEQEICEQPQILTQNAPRYFSELRTAFDGIEKPEMILLAARGSSDNAALYARYLIEIHLGIPVSLAAPSVITRYKSELRYPRTLVVGVSQSGAAPDVAEVLSYMSERGHQTLAITNTAESRLTKVADHSVILGAGSEKSVAATKTYTSTLVCLYELVRALGGNLQMPVLPDDAWIQKSRDLAEDVYGVLNRSNPVFAIARGYGFCTALETALKLMECALVPCKAYSSADFEHGPKALAGHNSVAISYFGSLQGLKDQGCEILQIEAPLERGPDRDPVFPIWDIVFGQWLSLLVARSRNLNPDQARHLSKVTETL